MEQRPIKSHPFLSQVCFPSQTGREGREGRGGEGGTLCALRMAVHLEKEPAHVSSHQRLNQPSLPPMSGH